MSVQRRMVGKHHTPRVYGDQETRFDAKWQRDEETGCHVWMACVGSHGYGCFSIENNSKAPKTDLAHRMSYRRHVGEIPEGWWVDHICRNRRCVNPDHLRILTPQQNKDIGTSPCAVNARKVECKWGHPLEGGNVVAVQLHNGNTGRHCLTCHKLTKRGAHPRDTIPVQLAVDAGHEGITAEEVRSSEPRLMLKSVDRALRSAAKVGLVEDSGMTRPSDTGSPSTVWRATAAGIAQWRAQIEGAA